ncbi:MAG TPA: nuclear transport factor 2 family protein [Flavobacterium sp.]|nr:nuclear transport factor 2 family protein [Flavobacterium sp.]
MKKMLCIMSLLLAFSIQAQNQEVQKTIETFFEGFHAKDSIKIKSVCDEKMMLQSISETSKGNTLVSQKVPEFIKSIVGIPEKMTFQEKLLSYTIQADGAMAHAWTPYEFYVNGKLSHKGVNSFVLFKEKDDWKIVYIIDTRRKG